MSYRLLDSMIRIINMHRVLVIRRANSRTDGNGSNLQCGMRRCSQASKEESKEAIAYFAGLGFFSLE